MLAQKYKLLSAFLFEPSKEKYGREIERAAGFSHERAVSYLKDLVKEKVLLCERKGRQVFYRLNRKSEAVTRIMSALEYERTREFLRSNKDAAVLLYDLKNDILSSKKGEIQFLVIFGSMARGESRAMSDIDLLAVTVSGKEPGGVRERIKRRSKIHGIDFSVHFVSLDELEKSWHKEPIYKNIWRERIVLYGESRFWEFVIEVGEAF